MDWVTSAYFSPRTDPPAPPSEPFEELEVPTADEASLHGFWFPVRAGEPRGVVVQAHGSAANLSGHWPLASGLADRGFHVLCFDYRGFGRSAGRPTRRRAAADLHAVLDFARPRAEAEGLPLLVLGQSMGAALALEVVADRDDVAALVVDAPFSSWPDIAWQHVGRGRWHSPFIKLGLYLTFRRGGREPVEAAAELTTPLLVITGSEDLVCPPAMAREIHAAAPPGTRLLVVQGAPHVGQRDEAQSERISRGVEEFFAGARTPEPEGVAR